MFDDLLVNTAKAYPIRLIGDPHWNRDSSPEHRRKLLLQELNEIWCKVDRRGGTDLRGNYC